VGGHALASDGDDCSQRGVGSKEAVDEEFGGLENAGVVVSPDVKAVALLVEVRISTPVRIVTRSHSLDAYLMRRVYPISNSSL
jgi:hypothetical protein